MTLMKTISLTEPMPATRPSYNARKLTDTEGLAQIVLDEKVYTLRITKAGKLILTK